MAARAGGERRLASPKRIPFPAGDGDHRLDVFREQIPIAPQRFSCGTNTREVILFGRVAFVDGLARIAARFAFGPRAWEYQRGPE